MGANSTDALEKYLSVYLSRCKVVGENIITPDRFDVTAGGHTLPKRSCAFCGSDSHPEGACPNLARDGTPDFKRGQ